MELAALGDHWPAGDAALVAISSPVGIDGKPIWTD